MSFFRKSKKDKGMSKKDKMDTFDARDIPHEERSQQNPHTSTSCSYKRSRPPFASWTPRLHMGLGGGG